MLDWDNLRVFLAAVRAGNYSTAARHLRIDRTTVGRKLERLEHQMGVTLFEQGDDGYHPTPAGKRALETADEIERLIQDLTDEVNPRSGPGPSTVRLSVAAELDCEFVPELARFSSAHWSALRKLVQF